MKKEEICVGDKETIKKTRLTKSTSFVRDMLGFHPQHFSHNYFNTYISIEPRNIYLVFKYEDDLVKSLVDLVTERDLRSNYEFVEKICEGSYEIYKYNVPNRHLINFMLFLDGKYTHFDDEYKQYLLNMYIFYNKDKFDNLKKILYPSRKDLDDLGEVLDISFKLPDNAEIFDKPDLEEELFNINKLI